MPVGIYVIVIIFPSKSNIVSIIKIIIKQTIAIIILSYTKFVLYNVTLNYAFLFIVTFSKYIEINQESFKNQSSIKSPVISNYTVGITLVMNFKKINRAKWALTLVPFLAIESDIVFRTAECLHGWTVGIVAFSMKGKASMVNVLSKYYFCMSSFIFSFSIGFPSILVALKYILGVW